MLILSITITYGIFSVSANVIISIFISVIINIIISSSSSMNNNYHHNHIKDPHSVITVALISF